MNPTVSQDQGQQKPQLVVNNQQPQAPQQGQAQGQSNSSNGQYDPNVASGLEQRLNSLPDLQKAFINHYLTPETVTLMGIVGGTEVYDYFRKYTDPSKMAVIVPRNTVPQGGQALQEDQQAEAAESSPSTGQDTEQAPAGQPQTTEAPQAANP